MDRKTAPLAGLRGEIVVAVFAICLRTPGRDPRIPVSATVVVEICQVIQTSEFACYGMSTHLSSPPRFVGGESLVAISRFAFGKI